MAIPISYNLRNLAARKTTTIMTALGIALSVAILVASLALVNGLRTVFRNTANPLQLLVLRKGGNSGLSSIVSTEAFATLRSQAGIAVGQRGEPLASQELVNVTNLPSVDNPKGMNVTVRGLSTTGIEMRKVRLIDGRWFQPGQREIVVGKAVAKRYPSARIGNRIRFGKGDWEIVGVMDGGQSALNSEIWGDFNQVSGDYNRQDSPSSVLLRATDTVTLDALKHSIEDDRRLGARAITEEDYYQSQTSSGAPLEFLGIFVAVIMAIGGGFAAMNTMYAGGGACVGERGDRTAANTWFFRNQHPGQLPDRINIAVGPRGNSGMSPGTAAQLGDNRGWEFYFVQRNCLSVSHRHGRYVCRLDFRHCAGRAGRLLAGASGGQERNPKRVARFGTRERLWEIVIQAKKLSKEYVRDENRVSALKNVDLEIACRDFVALMGPSGSGKSTLLHLIAAMDRPSSGEVLVLNQDLASLNSRELARWRNAHIGFIFQSFNLIPVLTALENVALPLKLTALNAKEQGEHATVALNLVGLGDRLHHFPRQLSGGQEQRVAIVRAIVTDPDFILADEPTGNLDAGSANDVLTLLSALNKEHGKTILLVTHDPHAAHYASIVRYLDKGLLLPEGQLPQDWIAAAAPASFQSNPQLGSEAQL